MALTRAQILALKNGLTSEQTQIPEWADEEGNASYLITEMSAADAEAWADSMTGERQVLGGKPGEMETYSKGNRMANLVARTVLGPDGSRLFVDGDAGWIGEQSSTLVQRLYEAAARLSGITAAAEDAAVKNSETVPSDGSSSDSAPTSDTPASEPSSVS